MALSVSPSPPRVIQQCCVLPAAYVLRDSWSELLRHLDEKHYKYGFIEHLIIVLKKMTEGVCILCFHILVWHVQFAMFY